MNSDPSAVVRTGLLKGCLGGLGLVIIFFVIGGLTYLLLGTTTLSRNVILVLSILSGPVIGTFGLLLPLYLRASRQVRNAAKSDETTPGDAP